MENRIAYRMLKDKDFVEGIRALIIDKDKNPHWSPARLEDVLPSDIEHYFTPFSHEENQAGFLELSFEK